MNNKLDDIMLVLASRVGGEPVDLTPFKLADVFEVNVFCPIGNAFVVSDGDIVHVGDGDFLAPGQFLESIRVNNFNKSVGF